LIYFVQSPGGGRIKIGTTARLSERLRGLIRDYKTDLRVLAVTDGGAEHEKQLHARFGHLAIEGEWFEPGSDLLDFINREGHTWDGTDELPPRPPKRAPLFTLKGFEPERAWLEHLRAHLGETSVIDLVRRAIVELAKRSKFPEPPPATFTERAEWGGRRKSPAG
jgi:hypothetical protein